MDNSTAVLLSAGSAIAGGLLSGAYQHFRDWLEAPQLKIDYEGLDGVNKSKYSILTAIKSFRRLTSAPGFETRECE